MRDRAHERDPDASKPFTREELGQVLRAAEQDESDWVGGACKIMAYAGPHISVLSGSTEPGRWGREPLRSDAIRGKYLVWHRPKTGKVVKVPIARQLQGWLGEWLDRPRPTHRTRYNKVLERISARVGFHVNPLRFRHTCAVYLHHEMGMELEDVAVLLSVDPETLRTYVKRTDEMRLLDLESRGF